MKTFVQRATGFVALAAGIAAAVLLVPAAPPAGFAADADKPKPPPANPVVPAPNFDPPAGGFEIRWADSPITIDGEGTDPAWKHAQTIDNFYLPWLKQPRAAKTATKAKLLWDREYLYFFAEMEDTDLYADEKEQDGMTWDNDVFELFFKPADDKPGYYEFQVNAAGTKMDMFLPRRGAGGFRRFRKDGDFHIDAKVKLRGTLNDWRDKDQGWTVEGRIPWTDFLRTGGRPAIGESWKFVLCRYDYSIDFEGPELSVCAPMKSNPFPNFHYFEDYAPIKFVGPAKGAAKPFGIEQRVAVAGCKVVGSPEPPRPFFVKRTLPALKLTYPICVANQPGTDRLLYVVQQWSYGPCSLWRTGSDPATGETEMLFKPDGVAYDICFHPKFAENGYFYVGSNSDKRSRITRYTMERTAPYKVDPASAKLIIDWPSDGHNGAAVTFGLDGLLYVTSGDGTSDSDTHIVGQRLDLLTSKVLRLDVDHPAPGKAYSVPSDNPFVDMKDAAPETWCYGLRNPWRITTDKKTGRIWVGQNGQDLWEQVYLISKGENYGWSVTEGSHPFYPNRKAGPTPIVKPTCEHPHSEFRSLTGGVVYYGEKFPDLRGAYIYGDYSTGKIWGAMHDGTKLVWNRELADTRLHITCFGVDSKGELLITDHRGKDEGGFYTLERTPADLPPSNFPTRLSESGLFASVKGHAMAAGVIPYSVNSPLWSDGAHKERWLALPGADSKIDYSRKWGWNFPEGTVLVKSFALEGEEGKPETRKWIETRFLHNRGGEWYGYSYKWNDEQTDGTLVASGGADQDFAIKTAAGMRTQKWHYPSRTECMVCHSRAANFVLGLTEQQMNRDHDYGNGVVDNQLRTLEHLGVFRINWAEEAKARMREELSAAGKTDKDVKEYMHVQTDTRLQRDPVISSLLIVPPAKLRRHADPYSPKEPLEARVRSYLHANCAHCHVEAGGGNAKMELDSMAALAKMYIVNEKPLHHTFDLPDARLIAPGRPEGSVLLHRLSHRNAGHMPPLATAMVDPGAVALVKEWIRALKPAETPAAK